MASELKSLLNAVSGMGLFKRAGNLGTPGKLRFYLTRTFDGVSFRGARVLDVGAGTGVCSFWAAAEGAGHVRALEPELDGGADTMNSTFRRILERLAFENVELHRETLQDMAPPVEPYDVIVMHNTVNHLDEAACRALPSPEAFGVYRSIFAKTRLLMRSGGTLVVTDCTNRCLFGDLRVVNPFAPSIDWRVHQPPSVWQDLLEGVGFERQRLAWTTMSSLGGLGARLFNNSVAAYLTFGHFVLTMTATDTARSLDAEWDAGQEAET